MINSKQRAFLRKTANNLETILQVGKAGVNEQVVKQVNEALEARELIKLRVLENSDYTSREAAAELSGATNSDVVQIIGSRFVLYKMHKNPEKRKIDINV